VLSLSRGRKRLRESFYEIRKTTPGVVSRFLRFNAVGALGVGVQLTTLWVLVDLWGAGYVPATAVAVGCAVVHNFLWHLRWTWGDRRTRGSAVALTFLRFAGTNGVVSIAGNVAVMVALVGAAGVTPVVANAIAIASTGLVNFATSHLFVFDGQAPGACSSTTTQLEVP
jgi:putative flippase GtrA